MSYIWQHENWPEFTWNSDILLPEISKLAALRGQLFAAVAPLGLEDRTNLEVEALVDDAQGTSLIEGQPLHPASVRSSVAHRLGLDAAGLPPRQREVDGLVAMLHDATSRCSEPLTSERLFGWHAALFPTGHSGLYPIITGGWRETPIVVQSGLFKAEEVHFSGPPPERVPAEMTRLLEWWGGSQHMEGVLRAGVAHLWFETVHPFEDGNGRVGRALADMALARSDKTPRRYYSLSRQLQRTRADYYSHLKSAQGGALELTEWLLWFIECVSRAVHHGHEQLSHALLRATLRRAVLTRGLNPRQLKVAHKLIETEPKGFEGGLSNAKYRAITRAPKATVTRDLADLVERGVLVKGEGGGRSTRYTLNVSLLKKD